MATYTSQSSSSSQRPMAMVLALVSALILSPLYASKKGGSRRGDFLNYDSTWMGSGLVVPMVLAGLIIAIRTSSKGSTPIMPFPSSDPSWVLRIGSSSWGLTGVLVMLILVVSWQHSFQDFIWS